MKKLATTIFDSKDGSEHIAINEYDNGTYDKIINEEIVTESSAEEIQEIVDSGKYSVQELTW